MFIWNKKKIRKIGRTFKEIDAKSNVGRGKIILNIYYRNLEL